MAYLNYEGLKRYDKKTKEYIQDKIDEVILNVGETDLTKYATKKVSTTPNIYFIKLHTPYLVVHNSNSS